MADSESHQGPPPERQTGPQMHDPPASGKGTDDSSGKEKTNQTALDVGLFSRRSTLDEHRPDLLTST